MIIQLSINEMNDWSKWMIDRNEFRMKLYDGEFIANEYLNEMLVQISFFQQFSKLSQWLSYWYF